MKNKQIPTIAIIGSGFSGLCAAIQVKKQLGITAQVYEMSSEIGGTWRDNTYPGCACDVPSPLYSFSFELNPNWSSHYSPHNEIFDYLKYVARKYNIYEQTRFRTEVIGLEWLQDDQLWKIQTRNLDSATEEVTTEYYNYVFAGLGPLSVPNVPPQFQSFTGTTVHTARWDSTIDFKNKNVAVIGNGASAVQAIPELRKVAKHLTLYQRTATWILPKDQFRYPRFAKLILKYIPFLMRLYRNLIFFQHELYFFNFGYNTSFVGKLVHSLFKYIIKSKLKRAGRPDLIPVLTPNFPPGCKRIAKSEDYIEAVAQPNVTVVTASIEKVDGTTLIDSNGNKEQVDILVLATGFNVGGFLGNLKIVGKDGICLNDEWASKYPHTYKGASIHGFPNFFLLLSAGVGLGHSSVVIIAECQVDYAIKCIKHAMKKDLIAIEPKLTAQVAYTTRLRSQLKGTVWEAGCNSWYLTADGEVFGIWPGTVSSFWWNCFNTGLGKNFIEYKK